jgi:hypothetical protein
MIATGNDNKKLKKVLSTKLSTEDYNVFRILTNQAYRSGAISQDSPSEMLRYMITPVVDGFRRYQDFRYCIAILISWLDIIRNLSI